MSPVNGMTTKVYLVKTKNINTKQYNIGDKILKATKTVSFTKKKEKS